MKKTPCLVGSRRVPRTSMIKHRRKSDIASDEDESQWEHELLLPNKVCNTRAYSEIGLRNSVTDCHSR